MEVPKWEPRGRKHSPTSVRNQWERGLAAPHRLAASIASTLVLAPLCATNTTVVLWPWGPGRPEETSLTTCTHYWGPWAQKASSHLPSLSSLPLLASQVHLSKVHQWRKKQSRMLRWDNLLTIWSHLARLRMCWVLSACFSPVALLSHASTSEETKLSSEVLPLNSITNTLLTLRRAYCMHLMTAERKPWSSFFFSHHIWRTSLENTVFWSGNGVLCMKVHTFGSLCWRKLRVQTGQINLVNLPKETQKLLNTGLSFANCSSF